MFSYIVAIIAFVLFLYNPIVQYLSPGPRLAHRTPKPQINESLLALPDGANHTDLACPPSIYTTHIFSKQPLILYIENFLNQDEINHLLEISNPLFEPSTITHDGAATQRDTTVRDSDVAVVPRTRAVRCVEERARALQGWRDELWLERLRTQRYGPGGHYGHHFDWSAGRAGWGRVSSFMAWVAAGQDLVGGGTEFPLLRAPSGDRRWCRFVECYGEAEEAIGTEDDGRRAEGGGAFEGGVVFKPVAGNAVFWENFRPDGTGRGYDETWHAGLPVTKGSKIGLNIWSWGRLD